MRPDDPRLARNLIRLDPGFGASLERPSSTITSKLFMRTNVERVVRDGDGFHVVTDRGSIRARFVVNASEAHTRGLFADYLPSCDPELIRTHKSQAMYAVGRPREMRAGPAILLPLGWFHPREDGFLFVSDNVRVPATQATWNGPSRFVTAFMCAETTRRWPPRPFRVLHEWTGTVGQAPDKFPVVGPLADPGVLMLGGFAGAGSATSIRAGKEVVEQILGATRPNSPWLQDLFGVARFVNRERYGERFFGRALAQVAQAGAPPIGRLGSAQ